MANRSFTSIVDEEYQKVVPRIRKKLQRSARNNHRYKNRTGYLTKSVSTSYTRGDKLVGLTAKAPYARYVIRGHGTWAPDPFVDNAIEREKEYTKKLYDEAISNAVSRYNKQKGGRSGTSIHSGI